jgi:hypothetical protein
MTDTAGERGCGADGCYEHHADGHHALPGFEPDAGDVNGQSVTLVIYDEVADPPPVHVHRWAYLVDGRQACGYCGAPR